MARYKVISYGGMDGLKLPDLLVRFSTGYLLPLVVKQGEYIPTEILDPLDIKKSLLAGSLGRFIAAGDIRVEDDNILPALTPTVVSVTTEAPKIIHSAHSPQSLQSLPASVATEAAPAAAVETPALTNLADVKTVDDFFKLGYFLKLRFIKECNNKGVLQEILVKTDSKQLQNNIQVKLAQLP